MTISTTDRSQGWAGDDSTVAFEITEYTFFAQGDLEVYIVDASDNETLQAIGTDYTVSDATVTMTTAPAATETLRIDRVVPKTQNHLDLTESGVFPSELLEEAIDRLVCMIQDNSIGASGVSDLTGTIDDLADGTSYKKLGVDGFHIIDESFRVWKRGYISGTPANAQDVDVWWGKNWLGSDANGDSAIGFNVYCTSAGATKFTTADSGFGIGHSISSDTLALQAYGTGAADAAATPVDALSVDTDAYITVEKRLMVGGTAVAAADGDIYADNDIAAMDMLMCQKGASDYNFKVWNRAEISGTPSNGLDIDVWWGKNWLGSDANGDSTIAFNSYCIADGSTKFSTTGSAFFVGHDESNDLMALQTAGTGSADGAATPVNVLEIYANQTIKLPQVASGTIAQTLGLDSSGVLVYETVP